MTEEVDVRLMSRIRVVSFFRIPKVLYTNPIFKDLSSDAKEIYGILLDRMELSMKNSWMDENNRVYIYLPLIVLWDIMGWGIKSL